MKFKDGTFSNLKTYQLGQTEVYVTDRHQYVYPVWTAYSNDCDCAYNLVSIDFHPDTNPPFWQVITLKMTLDNREEDQVYFEELTTKKLQGLDRYNLQAVIASVEDLNNDEHINTAMSLGVLKDYHMINCMDEHHYQTGKHYLLKETHYGSLEDEMFKSVEFKGIETPYILDIDLDYFMRSSDFDIEQDEMFRELVENADFITVARSVKYFEYLKKEEFTIDACESYLIDLLASYLEMKD